MSPDGGAPSATSPCSPSILAVGSVVGDAYEITGLLGKGGMGAVWAARHLRLPGKRVAIKVLLGGVDDAQALARFRREAEAASRIGHAGIVEVLDFNQLPDGAPYQVLEYLAGESLGARLRRGPLAVVTALDHARQIGSALAAAHRAGVVHRDLKPENIFLCPTDAGGVVAERVKVLDFGISRIRGSQTVKTQDNTLVGTPQYMAPEQASGDNASIDARTDLFALGAIVYEMLAGRPAFSGESLVAVIMNVVTGTPTPLATLVPGLAPQVTAAIGRALAKQPDDRFADVATFIEALTGQPLQTLGVAAATDGSSSSAPLSQEDLMAPTLAPSAVTPPSRATGGGPTGAPPIVISTARRLPQPKSPVPFAVAFVVLGAAAYFASSRPSSPSKGPPAGVSALMRAIGKANTPATVKPAVAPPSTVVVEAAVPTSVPAASSVVAKEPARVATHVREAALPADVRADLDGAEAALGRGDALEAKRLAQHSLLGQRTGRAFAILTRAACQDGDLTNARAGLRNVAGGERAGVVKACAAAGLDLR